MIYPQSSETHLPIASENNSYFVKLFFAGEWKCILVDDCLPMVDKKYVFPTVLNSSEMWTQIICKAIVKFLYLSERLTFDGFSVPMVVQMITGAVFFPSDFRFQTKSLFFVKRVKHKIVKIETIETSLITDWSTISTINEYVINDDNSSVNWCCMHSAHFHSQTTNDLWIDHSSPFISDTFVIISTEKCNMNVIFEIRSLNKNTSEIVSFFRYNLKKNIKICVCRKQMAYGLTTIVIDIGLNFFLLLLIFLIF